MALKNIANAVYFEQSGFEHLTYTPGAADSTTTWTLSFWFKRARNVIDGLAPETVWSAGTDIDNYTSLGFELGHRLRFRHVVAGADIVDLRTAALFNDPTTWAHIVVRYDSTEAVEADRVRIWYNNIAVTDFLTATAPALDAATDLLSTQLHSIGRRERGEDDDQYYDGYLADLYLCDGQALSPSDFAEADTPAWQPIAASPTFGAEGFFLEWGTAAALGDDTSGNTNDWTPSALATSNQRDDTPTRPYVLWNQHYFGTGDTVTIREGSRHLTAVNTVYVAAGATHPLPKTGKYYWEIQWGASSVGGPDKVVVGIMTQAADINGRVGDDNHGWGLYNSGTTVVAVRHDGADTNFTDTAAFAIGDIYNIAYDADTGDLWFGLDGVWFDSGDPGAGANPAVTLTAADIIGGTVIPAGALVTTNNRLDFNPTTEDQTYAAPSGFKTLSLDQWLKPPITDPTQYVDVLAYVGNSVSPRTLTGLNFGPDFVWLKNTALDPSNHLLANTVVGPGNIWYNDLSSGDISSHNHGEIAVLTGDGFTVDKSAVRSDLHVNTASPGSNDFVSIAWKEDPVAGFDIVGYAGTSSAQAINHDLGAPPDHMYVRNRGSSQGNKAYARNILSAGEIVADPETDYFEYNTAIGVTDLASIWNDVAPTDTQFTVGTHASTNQNTANHMAHLFREIEGFSKFTSYIGTGDADEESPFIYCGFKPKIVFIKRTNVASDWILVLSDTSRSALPSMAAGGVGMQGHQFPNEDSDIEFGIGSTGFACGSGFKINQGFSDMNALGAEYTVMIWAEAPMTLLSMHSTQKFGAGAIDLGFVLDATGDDPNQYGDGAVDLSFQLSGEGTGGLPKGAGTPGMRLEIIATGSAPEFRHGAGAIDLTLGISGQGFNTAIRGIAVELPQLTTDATIVRSFPMDAEAIPLPLLQTEAFMPDANAVSGNPRLPVLQIFGEFAPENFSILPQLTVVSTILAGATVRAPTVLIPVLQTDAVGDSPIILTSNALLPRLGVDAIFAGGSLVVSGGVLIGSAVSLPALDANGFLLIPQEMAGFITLPALDVGPDAILAPGAIVTGSVTLPLLRLESILVNGVTLVGTVWAMNTETLETTNYLNFDFNSLVSFADQPYGVTSSGIFLLEGDDDDGTNIDARILTGISDRGDENLKEAAQMYMQYEGQAMMFQLYPDGQQRLREYRFERRSNSTGVIHARAKGSRGLRSRSWQMGLRNLSGGAFTLDKLGLLLRALTRNTRKN